MKTAAQFLVHVHNKGLSYPCDAIKRHSQQLTEEVSAEVQDVPTIPR